MLPLLRPRTPDEVGPAVLAAVARFDRARPVAVLGHFDADGLAATALLARALPLVGLTARPVVPRRGETPWSPEIRARLAALDPGGLVVADLGIGDRPILPGVPELYLDHHVPGGWPPHAVVVSGHGWTPEPPSALLAFWGARALGADDDLGWLAALGILGDMAEGGGWPELAAARARHGVTALRDATALVNAPRRASAGDAGPALALLLRCGSPRELLRGGHPETAALEAARAEVAEAMAQARRVPPKVRGEIALVRVSSPCQVHPLLAQQWRARFRDRIVIAANTGYREGWVHFAVRTLADIDLVAFLARHRPEGAGPEYGQGHRQATGGALRHADWDRLAASLGFPDAAVPDMESR